MRGTPISAIFVPVGTCATLLGLARHKAAYNRNYRIVPVDVEGSRLFGDAGGKRIFPGVGNGSTTPFAALLTGTEPAVVVSNASVVGAAALLREAYGLSVGASGAAVFAAYYRLLRDPAFGGLGHSGEAVLLAPDAGGHYAETLYNRDWLARHNLQDSTIAN